MIWPWSERFELFPEFKNNSKKKYPKFAAWREEMKKVPVVKAMMFSTDTHRIFYQTYADNKPDFDYGL
jgi:hypothetical protein